ncbi:MAG: hypothetical protein A4S16_01590 [Proteobacteria bacterium SG_bin6]|nr:MAG: hypothetical protein A4S16_01590 [Proteobacteria bacterium SG_bin6]
MWQGPRDRAGPAGRAARSGSLAEHGSRSAIIVALIGDALIVGVAVLVTRSVRQVAGRVRRAFP